MSSHRSLTSIVSEPAVVREVAHGLYTALPEEIWSAPYDRKAAWYDAVLSWSIYHRVMWGTSPLLFTEFGKQAFDAAGRGPFAEVGCGSLLFTSRMYHDGRDVPVTVIDRSLPMLHRAIKRLGANSGRAPDDVVALHADATALPVRSGIFASILSLNLLHVPCDRPAIVAEFGRTLIPGRGRLFMSSLIRSGRWSDAYLAMLHRAGEFDVPLTLDELCETVSSRWGVVESTRVVGNMSFLVVRHAG
jgi:SAM-dependent methyltransferase